MTKRKHPSISKGYIIFQISELYSYAIENSDLEFIIPYSGTGTNYNYYTPQEMADMFSYYSIPENMTFEIEFSKLLKIKEDII